MLQSEMPTIGASSYGSTAYGLNGLGSSANFVGITQNATNLSVARRYDPFAVKEYANKQPQPVAAQQEETEDMADSSKRRLVQVLIVDPDERVPLDDCLLYRGEPKMTEATDQELFFEVDIKNLLAAHNERRVKVVDKKVKERQEYLEPAKIRELKMVVVTIAAF